MLIQVFVCQLALDQYHILVTRLSLGSTLKHSEQRQLKEKEFFSKRHIVMIIFG